MLGVAIKSDMLGVISPSVVMPPVVAPTSTLKWELKMEKESVGGQIANRDQFHLTVFLPK